MAEHAKATIPYRGWEPFKKPYYEPRNGYTRDWQPEKHTTAIARQYAATLEFIKELIIDKPTATITLLDGCLTFQWDNGEGKMLIDEVDMTVLIPRIEQATGLQLVGSKFQKAA